eukprot:3129922-Lingulodinium_polyedra.AAC.1
MAGVGHEGLHGASFVGGCRHRHHAARRQRPGAPQRVQDVKQQLPESRRVAEEAHAVGRACPLSNGACAVGHQRPGPELQLHVEQVHAVPQLVPEPSRTRNGVHRQLPHAQRE